MTLNPDHTVSSDEITALSLSSILLHTPSHNIEHLNESIELFVLSAAQKTSLTHTTRNATYSHTAKTATNHIRSIFQDVESVEKSINASLHSFLPKNLQSTKRKQIAIDAHLIPYYGDIDHSESVPYVLKKDKKLGTNKFFGFATACMLHGSKRYVLGFTMIRRNESMHEIVKRLFAIMRKTEFYPSICLLDKEFYDAKIMRYLTRKKIPFIIPAKRQGQKLWRTDDLGKSKTPDRLATGWYRYTLNKNRGKKDSRRPYTIDLCIVNKRKNNKNGELKNKTRGFVCWGLRKKSPSWVEKTYSFRFGIESSYRQTNQCKAYTCTRNPILRCFWFGIALILRQCWVFLHFEAFSKGTKGPRVLNLQVFTFIDLLSSVVSVLRKKLGKREKYNANRQLQLERFVLE